jgi:hypothetical protein
VRFHRIGLLIRRGELKDQMTAQGRFARPDMTHHHIKSPAETDGELQLLQTTDMLGGLKEKFGLG